MTMSRWNGLLRAHVDKDITTIGDLAMATQSFKVEVKRLRPKK